jgi:hypothetical protein
MVKPSEGLTMMSMCGMILLLSFFVLSFILILSNDSFVNNFPQSEAKRPKSIHSFGNENSQRMDEQKPSILICCNWPPDKIGNGGTGLTYRIIGGSATADQAVQNALEDWSSNIKSVKFTRLQESDDSADITIKFNSKSSQAKLPKELKLSDKNNNGIVLEAIAPGATKIHFDQNGVITGVVTTISKSVFGDKLSFDVTKQIAKHELGHALGLGHANFNGDLMSATLNNESDSISQCDINAALEANHLLTENNNHSNNIEKGLFSC